MDEETYTITGGPLKPHEYIIVRREMTAADEAWIQNHSASVTGDKKNPQIQLTIGDVRLATLKRMILSWHITRTEPVDGQQHLIPLSDHAVENLPRRVSAFVLKVIDKLNPDEEENDEAFLPGANGSSETNLTPTNLPSLKV